MRSSHARSRSGGAVIRIATPRSRAKLGSTCSTRRRHRSRRSSRRTGSTRRRASRRPRASSASRANLASDPAVDGDALFAAFIEAGGTGVALGLESPAHAKDVLRSRITKHALDLTQLELASLPETIATVPDVTQIDPLAQSRARHLAGDREARQAPEPPPLLQPHAQCARDGLRAPSPRAARAERQRARDDPRRDRRSRGAARSLALGQSAPRASAFDHAPAQAPLPAPRRAAVERSRPRSSQR